MIVNAKELPRDSRAGRELVPWNEGVWRDVLHTDGTPAQIGRRLAEGGTIAQRAGSTPRVGVIVFEADGRIVAASDVAVDLLALPKEALVAGRQVESGWLQQTDGTALPAEAWPHLLAARAGHRPPETVVGRRLAGGELRRLLIGAEPLLGPGGVVERVICTVLDVTAEVEAALPAAETEVRKSDFLSAVAHDLKGPLTAIKGHAQLLLRRARREQTIDADRVIAEAERIESTAGRMADLITELLDLSRIERGRPLDLVRISVDLVPLVAESVAQQGVEAAGRIEVRSDVAQFPGRWDAVRLRRVIGAILTNALHYSPQGTTVDVLLTAVPPADEAVAELTVRDDGIGIPAADLPRVFDSFYRASNVPTESEGAGLGLTVARQIVRQLGGEIEIESVEGRGTSVRVQLPAHGGAEG